MIVNNYFVKKQMFGIFNCLIVFYLECNIKLYLGFLFDGFGSINKYDFGNYKKCLGFVKGFVRVFFNLKIGVIVFLY